MTELLRRDWILVRRDLILHWRVMLPSVLFFAAFQGWMVREISRHPRDELVTFLKRFEGRILFGSDIVTHDDHLEASDPDNPKFGNQLASSQHEAFELYASRYWAQRTMWETGYVGESNIADPDLAMVEPGKFTEMDGPAWPAPNWS